MSNDLPPVQTWSAGTTAVAPSAAQPVPQTASEMLRLGWSQPPGLVGLSVKNFLLRIVTLGIYHFWGKTEVRQRIWSGIRINGEPLHYTGTGREMLLGFLFVLGVVAVPTFLVSLLVAIAFGSDSMAMAVFQGLIYVPFLLLIGVGIHRATRYRLSRTRWRGIRGGLEGSAWHYGWTYFWTVVVLVLSLGWASPWRSVKLQGLITNDMRFGDRPFGFAATAGPLYGRFAVLWVSGLVILLVVIAGLMAGQFYMVVLGTEMLGSGGQMKPEMLILSVLLLYASVIVGFLLYSLVSAWYRAHMMNHFAAHTTFEGARFKGTATGGSLVWITFSNYLMALVSQR